MGITTSNLPRLLRAAITHRNATTLLHPPPLSVYHPSNFPISNPRLGHTFLSRRVSARATAHPNLGVSNPHLLIRSVHTRATALHKHRSIWPYALTFGCIAATGGMIVLYKYREKPWMIGRLSNEQELRYQGSIPHLYRMGHSVVVAGIALLSAEGIFELYLSASEVLAQPHHVAAALQRNNIILDQKVSKEILATNRRWSDEISESAVELSKSESQGKVSQLDSPEFLFEVTQGVILTLKMFEDLPNLLREGHSVFIKCSTIKENKSDESNEIKWAKSITGKIEQLDYHLSAEAVAKHDERYMPREEAAAAAASAIGRNVEEK